MKLDGRQFAQVQGVLLHSFDRDSLRMMVRLQLDEDLDAVAGDDDLTTVVFDLITWAERTNRVRELVNGARAANPGNPEVQQLAADYERWQAAAPASAPAPALATLAPVQETGRSRWVIAAIVAVAVALLAFWLLRPYLWPARPIEPTPVEPTLPALESPLAAAAETATATPKPQPPHAPPLKIDPKLKAFEEQTRLWTIKSGESLIVDMRQLWTAPEGAPADCASGYLVLSWQVREPYPGGHDLEILRTLPRGGGQSVVVARGARGGATVGRCDELTLHNGGLEGIRLELRYASAINKA